ncbi:MAG: sigma-70 family RNA polymerase sigma factor [Gemmatimonadaceae bacterium]|nr:sigma-70 family RNA polymerase sigma factor [Gemmatimonadaceae bacterium]
MSPLVALDRTSDDDARLVQLMRLGDERALAALYDRYAPSLLGLIQRIVRERADAESVLMATFLQAWRTAASFDAARGSLLSWLATIARSRAVDSARSGARRERREQLVTEQDAPIAEAEAPGSTDPLDGITQQERRTAIEAALTSLSAPQRTVIELAFFEGLTHVEIAERLAEPLGTIKTRIRQGLIKLRGLLAPLAQERVA